MINNNNTNLYFPLGIIGFEPLKNYKLEASTDLQKLGPFQVLQCEDVAGLRFYVYVPAPEEVPLSLIRPFCEKMDIQPNHLLCLILVTIRRTDMGFHFTGNFYAPLLCNVSTSQGWQVVLESPELSMHQEIFFVPTSEPMAAPA